MRELHCAHVLIATAAPVVQGRIIRIDGEHIETVGPMPPGPAEPMLAYRRWSMPMTTHAP